MKSARNLAILWIFLLIISSCDSYKETQQRRNFMMPEKADLNRNNKYEPSKKKKTYSPSKKRKKSKKR